MKIAPLDKGVKYLGFHLKPNDYKYVDCVFLIKKIEAKISCWCHGGCRGGRLVLVKLVLESILVYWLSISYIPKGVLENIRRKCFNFSGQEEE
jgi:hypothetical protein